ncbi:MAG: hypothetical protein KF708_04920 [Pirellulales bacterium]|nr:hypothetical protein [Pirellulales bacterium]
MEDATPAAASCGTPQDDRQEELLGARAVLHAAEVQASTRFDAVILLLSCAALALSVFWTQGQLPAPTGRLRFLLALARIDFLASIGTSLCALQSSRMATRHELRMLDRAAADPAALREETAWTGAGDVLRWVALGTFAGGVVFLLWFAVARS